MSEPNRDQEWTVEMVEDIWSELYTDPHECTRFIEAIVTAHNASLAAERDEVREQMQSLVDALREVREYCSGAGEMIIDGALAKLEKENL